MESPPSSSTWSEAFILSDDSGLLLTSGSISSGSMSGESRSGLGRLVLEDSDCEDKSLSQADSLDGMSDIMCGENFNTLKKGPHWTEFHSCKNSYAIEPPLEFQDKPNIDVLNTYANKLILKIVKDAYGMYFTTDVKPPRSIHLEHPAFHVVSRTYCASEFLPFSPCHVIRPNSKNSFVSSRLSSSHNSLSVPAAQKADDSSFITQAVSHDTLTSNQISDLYNVPFDSDVYAVPVDMVKPLLRPKRNQQLKKRRRNTSSGCRELEGHIRHVRQVSALKKSNNKIDRFMYKGKAKRHSVAGTSEPAEGEPIHMTLQEVRQYLQTLYSSSSDSSEIKDRDCVNNKIVTNNNKYPNNGTANGNADNILQKYKRNTFLINIKNKKVKDSCDNLAKDKISVSSMSAANKQAKSKKSPAGIFSLKQTLCNMFRFRRFLSPEHAKTQKKKDSYVDSAVFSDGDERKPITNRALPPLPGSNSDEEEQSLDFATSIHKVKDYGWYWGPLSSEAAEKILSNEPDGSFIVRDSSDDHYIFSLTFKLNNCVRHVRIEHDQGNFSFGCCTKFKSQTIVEFIENAVEHSRSGRYLFFLHRRPVIGPVRVQLLHPVSRFKHTQSLQHMSRFVILKLVRRDLIPSLPLPRRIIDYLNTPHYYSEHLFESEELDESNVMSSSQLFSVNANDPDAETTTRRSTFAVNQIPAIPNNVPVNNYAVISNPLPATPVNDTRQS